MGYGWTFNYGMNVREEDGNALVMVEDGRDGQVHARRLRRLHAAEGELRHPDQVRRNVHLLKRKDQTRYNFNASGKLASIVDKNSNTVTLGLQRRQT